MDTSILYIIQRYSMTTIVVCINPICPSWWGMKSWNFEKPGSPFLTKSWVGLQIESPLYGKNYKYHCKYNTKIIQIEFFFQLPSCWNLSKITHAKTKHEKLKWVLLNSKRPKVVKTRKKGDHFDPLGLHLAKQTSFFFSNGLVYDLPPLTGHQKHARDSRDVAAWHNLASLLTPTQIGRFLQVNLSFGRVHLPFGKPRTFKLQVPLTFCGVVESKI